MKRDRSRLILVFGIFIFSYLAILIRLFYWQVLESDVLKNEAKKQSFLLQKTTPIRGDILFKDGFPVATNKISYLLYVNPKKVDSADNYAKLLSPVLQLDTASLSARINQNLYWVSLKSRLTFEEKSQIEKMKLSALGFELQTDRNYPEASMAAHLVGFLGKNKDGEPQGYFGLEGYYDRQLKGRGGNTYLIKDALGNPILTDIKEDKKIDGRTLITTVDRRVQFIVDNTLRKSIEKYSAEGGSVIVMESNTGKVLAAVSYPKFDPQKYWEYDGSTYSNPIVSKLYEPGSTFKVLVMSAGIDSKLVKPQTKCQICGGPVTIDEYKIKTWNDQYIPNIDMTGVIQHSDNIGMVFVGQKLGLDRFLSYIQKFGFGKITGIDIQGEAFEELRPKRKWADIDLATASFGQGISVTPIQLISAINSIANEGKLVKPMLVDRIITPEKETIVIKPQIVSQPISSATAKIITLMMVNAVENGEAKYTKIPNYRIAGKTGTAQIPVEGHYDPTNTNASFIGFFPAEKPKITMLVIINKPQSSIYGAETAAPTFFSIAEKLIEYYNIEPSK